MNDAMMPPQLPKQMMRAIDTALPDPSQLSDAHDKMQGAEQTYGISVLKKVID
jgi:hypothetical protein